MSNENATGKQIDAHELSDDTLDRISGGTKESEMAQMKALMNKLNQRQQMLGNVLQGISQSANDVIRNIR